MLHNLHLLRAIAALGVVYFHITSTAGLNLSWDVGSRGVDIFFVISGFIIAYIGDRRPEHFFRRRLIRIVPFYWAATLVVFAAAAAMPQFFRSTTADVSHLLYSLFFIPHVNAATGETLPTLILGWSLNFEMYFYVVFALALLWGGRRAPMISVAVIVTLTAIITFSGSSDPVLAFYGRPIVLEFCYGVAAFYAYRACAGRASTLAGSLALKWALVVVLGLSSVAIVLLEFQYRDTMPRYLLAGIPAFFIVLSALLLERLFQLSVRWPVVNWLGEASYIIYLIHPYIVFSVLRLFFKQPPSTLPATAALIVFLLVLTSLVSVAIPWWFERPVMAALRRRLLPVRAQGSN